MACLRCDTDCTKYVAGIAMRKNEKTLIFEAIFNEDDVLIRCTF